MHPRIQLRVEPATGPAFVRRIDRAQLLVGRSSEADLQISDPSASRLHTRLAVKDGCLRVEDLNSHNGTWVNERRIEEVTTVAAGDVFEIGGTRFLVQEISGATPTTVAGGAGSEMELVEDPSSFLRQEETGDPEAVRRYAERLELVNEVHQELAGSLALHELLALILDRVFEHLRPEQAMILLRDDDGEYRPAATRSEEPDDIFYSTHLVREVGEEGRAAMVRDTSSDERFAEAQSILTHRVRSILAAPLHQGERKLGLIALSSRSRARGYQEDDLALLVSLASVAAMRIHNVELLHEAAERRRLEAELGLARQIQKRLLPKRLPEIEGYRLFGRNTASRWVSGDFYSVGMRASASGGDECVLLLADVSGKGIAASLLAASIEALAAGPMEIGLPPDEICARVSRRLFDRTPGEKYATAFAVVVEPSSGAVTYCNAGHNPGLVVRGSGQVESLGSTGVPIGLLAEAKFERAETRLDPGDTLFLYTDGLTEATNPEDEEYGLERLTEVCSRNAASVPEDMAAAVEEHMEHFAEGVPYADDRTMLMVRRLG